MNRSSTANRYRTLAAEAAEKYRLNRDGEHTAWCDAVDADGAPINPV